MRERPLRLAITSNGPGEFAGWVRPLLRALFARAPDTDVTLFFVPDDYATGREPDVARLGAHPVAEVRPREADLAHHHEDLGGDRLVLRAVAEVARDGVGERVLACEERSLEGVEMPFPLLVTGRAVSTVRALEERQRLLQIEAGPLA